MYDLTVKAASRAAVLHAGQFRKYPDAFGLSEPYVFHCGRVASSVIFNRHLFDFREAPVVISAAWLHDTLEDCQVTYAELAEEFGLPIANLVQELTNPSKGSTASRAERKAMDREHLADVTRNAKLIKTFDRIDNIRSLVNAPADFARLYLDESLSLAEALKDADEGTYQALLYTIKQARAFFANYD
jgi:(p)ppGpp synthase/HD superfamily hydrolase